MPTITFNGTPPRKPTLRVPGWGGGETRNHFQPWHSPQFTDAAEMGVELIYPYKDLTVTKDACPPPFAPLSEQFYQLELDTSLSASEPLLILPHYRFYTDASWSTPLPVACSWDTWWPGPLTVVFRHTPSPTAFKKGEPIAQVISTGRDCVLVGMGEAERLRKKEAMSYIEKNAGKYTTRKWVTATGFVQDNLYNVLSQMNRANKMPPELAARAKKFHFRRTK